MALWKNALFETVLRQVPDDMWAYLKRGASHRTPLARLVYGLLGKRRSANGGYRYHQISAAIPDRIISPLGHA